jgi:hypothetical protein
MPMPLPLRSAALIAAIAFATCGLVYGQQPRVSTAYGRLPLSFEINQGQSAEQVKFLARGQGYSLFLTASEAVLRLRAPARDKSEPDTVVRMRLLGAEPNPALAGLERLPGTSNYFIGNDPAKWQRQVPSFGRVKYTGVYPGIDLVYYGNQRQLEYDFLVAAHADPRRIVLAFDGVRALSLDAEGNLILQTSYGEITQHKPVIYQDIDGKRQRVDGRYVLRAKHRVGFHIARYDTSRPLVIDPVLSYATYLGGSSNDIAHAIAVDGSGSAYVTGVTSSTNFPGVGGNSIRPANSGSDDVFVTKLNAAGSAIVYSTYLGGSGADIGHAIAVDSAGNAYVTGETNSGTPTPTSVPFPTTAAFDASYNLGGDAFVSKLNAAGNALLYSTFLGGGGTERAYGIAVDASGAAYVTGHTNSDNVSSGPTGGFPTLGPLQANNSAPGSYDAFVTKFSPAGALAYSTYLGGTGNEFSLYGGAIAVDSAGSAYVGGSAGGTFPGTTGNFQGTFGGGVSDGFVAKLTPAGGALVWSTFLGGTTYDAVHGLAINAGGEVFVSGYTDSTNFPVAAPIRCVTPPGGTPICSQLTPFQATKRTGEDAFVTRFNATGTALIYSTYLGGNGGERAYDIAVDSSSTAYVAGWTTSSDFPINSPIQATNAGSNGDVFISAVNECGCFLEYSTYLGGNSGSETARGIALDADANVYVTGETNSTNFPTMAPLQATRSGSIGTDAFVAKVIVPPFMSLDRRSLAFGAVSTGAAFTQNTAPQSVRLRQFGAGTASWTATSTAPWLVVSPASGSGTATLTISVQFVAGLAGSQSGAINVAFTGASNASDTVNATLTVVSGTPPSIPFGVFDTPAGDATVLAGSIAVTGWTLDDIGVKRVELWRDLQPGETAPPFAGAPGDPRNGKIFVANASFVDGARPDVEALHPTTPFSYRAGWGYLLLTWGLFNQGNGTYALHAFAFDQEDNVATIGSKTIIVSNTTATAPFGSIDTPSIGGDASGPNFGWALTPRVNGVATCKIQPSGVQVSIDSGPLQPVAYGDNRIDIAGLFPGFSNSDAAGGHYIFDWSTLTNGAHTIAWLITDNCGRADGVGSRYFNVTGGTNLTAATIAAVSAVTAPQTESTEAITVARGYGELPEIIRADDAGGRTIEIAQGVRLEIRLPRGFESAYQLGPGGQRRPLPIGATWDAASGTFYWQPGPGFLGRYRIVFTNGTEHIRVRVMVAPKG